MRALVSPIIGTVVLLGATLLAVADRASAECQANELARLRPPYLVEQDHFGWSVAISGDVAVIGSSSSAFLPVIGWATVYKIDVPGKAEDRTIPEDVHDGAHWVEQTRLFASDGNTGDGFGGAVGIDGDVIAVGAPHDDVGGSSAGSVYVFRHDGEDWGEQAKLCASDPYTGDEFGNSVAISGDVIVIGAQFDDDHGLGSGSAYIFRYDDFDGTWTEEAKLTPADGATWDSFGNSVSISGDVAVIGCVGDDGVGSGSGSAYVYRYDNGLWIEEAKLVASDAATMDYFGRSVCIWEDTIVVGAPRGDDMGEDSGAAYIYRYDGAAWAEEAKLTASDGGEDEYFGRSVSVWGEVAVIGALDIYIASNWGAAYVFRCQDQAWHEEAKLVASDAAAGDYFGRAVCINGDRALIGAPQDDDGGWDTGSAYAYHGLSDCNHNETLDLCDIVDGTSEDLNADGIPDECEGLGDLDCDGEVDFDDIDPFVLALTGQVPYEAEYPDCQWFNADCNNDGDVDFDDIDPFVALLATY